MAAETLTADERAILATLDECQTCGYQPLGPADVAAHVHCPECGALPDDAHGDHAAGPDRHAYTAQLYGSSWAVGPVTDHPTITDARRWAEEYGSTADLCVIRDHRGREVARHVRDTAGEGARWNRAAA